MSPLGYASSSARARERAAPGRRGSLSGLRLLERRILLRPGRSLVPCGLDRLHHLGAARHRRRWSVTWHRSFLSLDPPAEGSAGPDLARRAGSLRKAPIMMRRALAKTDLDQSGCEIFREALSQSRRQSGALRRPPAAASTIQVSVGCTGTSRSWSRPRWYVCSRPPAATRCSCSRPGRSTTRPRAG